MKPCPFCGESSTTTLTKNMGEPWRAIKCTNCSAQTGFFSGGAEKEMWEMRCEEEEQDFDDDTEELEPEEIDDE